MNKKINYKDYEKNLIIISTHTTELTNIIKKLSEKKF